jgi:hypothetical protein
VKLWQISTASPNVHGVWGGSGVGQNLRISNRRTVEFVFKYGLALIAMGLLDAIKKTLEWTSDEAGCRKRIEDSAAGIGFFGNSTHNGTMTRPIRRLRRSGRLSRTDGGVGMAS